MQPRDLAYTREQWTVKPDGTKVYDTPFETGAFLDSCQGKTADYLGTCGLVSCVNVLRLSGVYVTEDQIVKFAAENNLCSKGSLDPCNNGGTTDRDRNRILSRFGLSSSSLPQDINSIAKYVESGRGVIVSVHADMLYNGRISNRDLHAVTVTSIVRNPDGSLKGFYICDSNDMPSQFYSAGSLQAALSGRCMNVTSQIIR